MAYYAMVSAIFVHKKSRTFILDFLMRLFTVALGIRIQYYVICCVFTKWWLMRELTQFFNLS